MARSFIGEIFMMGILFCLIRRLFDAHDPAFLPEMETHAVVDIHSEDISDVLHVPDLRSVSVDMEIDA